MWIVVFFGLLIAVFSALERHVQWIAAFCAFFGEGCLRTEKFTLFKIPISWWGIGYYCALGVLLYFYQPLVFWFVMIGAGFELSFLWIMVAIRAFCIFCLFNALAVFVLVWMVYTPDKILTGAVVALLFFIVSKFLISSENKPEAPGSSGDVTKANAGDEPTLGSPAAGVTVVEFSDPFCPACRKMHQVAKKIRAYYGNKIHWIFRDFPLEIHEGAHLASQASHCAGEQDDAKFWQYQDFLYETDIVSGLPDLYRGAERLGLKPSRFKKCLKSGRYRHHVDRNIESGKKTGISAVPAYVINGEIFQGFFSFEEFRKKVDDALNASNPNPGTPG
ncbi:MAG: thioredoxin domain-containing protein [Desulfobacterales bacterium]